jgi:hypothetical protein
VKLDFTKARNVERTFRHASESSPLAELDIIRFAITVAIREFTTRYVMLAYLSDKGRYTVGMDRIS